MRRRASRFHQLFLPSLLAVAMLRCAGSVEAGRANAALAAQRKLPPGAAEQFQFAHNQARAAVGVAPLRWSDELAGLASGVVRHRRGRCALVDTGKAYGMLGSWASYRKSPAAVVASWVEKGYAQVVWRNTAEVGCTQQTCGRGGGTLTLCLYYPAAARKYAQGQKPYYYLLG